MSLRLLGYNEEKPWKGSDKQSRVQQASAEFLLIPGRCRSRDFFSLAENLL
jgi:hypothetical protein